METINRRCAGLDVHKDSVYACVRSDGKEFIEKFGTSTRELLRLGDFMASHGVTVAAMESTGVYWKPVWNVLEDRFQLMLVNAHHVRQVPGRKTDVARLCLDRAVAGVRAAQTLVRSASPAAAIA